jgi:hypothetical protein
LNRTYLNELKKKEKMSMNALRLIMVFFAFLAMGLFTPCGSSSPAPEHVAQAIAAAGGSGNALGEAVQTALITPSAAASTDFFKTAGTECPSDFHSWGQAEIGCYLPVTLTERGFGQGDQSKVSGAFRMILDSVSAGTEPNTVNAGFNATSTEAGEGLNITLTNYLFTLTVEGTNYTGTLSTDTGSMLTCQFGGVVTVVLSDTATTDTGTQVTVTCTGNLNAGLTDGTNAVSTISGSSAVTTFGLRFDGLNIERPTNMVVTIIDLVYTINSVNYECSGTGNETGMTSMGCASN